MFSLYKNIYRISCKYSNLRCLSSVFTGNPCLVSKNKTEIIPKEALSIFSCRSYSQLTDANKNLLLSLETKRHFSKKKGSKRTTEEDEESDSDEEYEESIVEEGDVIVTRNVASLRMDTVLKAALGLTKKKIEQEFYAFKFRCNGIAVTKKSLSLHIGDEVDRVRGFSPDTSKYLLVDRIIIKGVDKITGSGMIPLKMEILKQLTVENYEDPWNPSSLGDLEK